MLSIVVILLALFVIAVASCVHEPMHHAPQPYKFSYDIKDKLGEQYRQETGDGHSGVKGSYGFTDARGVKRQVDYVADKAGFRAQVKTNEPVTANQNLAAVLMVSNASYAGGYGLGGYGAVGLGRYGGYGGAELGGYGGYSRYGLGYGGYAGYAGLGYGRYAGYGGLAILDGLGYTIYGY